MARLGLLVLLGVASAFPASDNPIAGTPPLKKGALKCTVELFVGVALTNYNQIATAPYATPDASCFESSLAVLEWEGSLNAGRQYDRYGALWLGGVELLRTTTPEPNSANAIAWTVEKDISDYKTVLGARDINASLSIPNTVDATYTGVLTISANVSFFEAADVFSADAVLVVADPMLTANPWDAMGVQGIETVKGTVKLPFQDANRVVVDLFASGHACDEFWYTNVPGTPVTPGMCGQGAFREYRLYIDGMLAGVAAPFPVVYTGGIVPYLWRPLTGIESFDVPAYRFDVTPFAALLNDGKAHVIEADVAFANNASGVWYLDPVVLAWSADAPAPLTGGITLHSEQPLDVTVTNTSGNYTTVGNHGVVVSGYVQGPMNPRVDTTVVTKVSVSNRNDFVGQNRQITVATIKSSAETSAVDWRNATTTRLWESVFPISVDLDAREPDSASLYLAANVSYAYFRRYRNLPTDLSWSDRMEASASLNETNEPGAPKSFELGAGATSESVEVASGGETCYARDLKASNGSVLDDGGARAFSACDLPPGLRFCGDALCGYDYAGLAPKRPAAPGGGSPATLPGGAPRHRARGPAGPAPRLPRI